MVRLGQSEVGTGGGNFVYLPHVGRTCWAQNWRGEWVRQVMHKIPALVGPEDDAERAKFVDKILARRSK